MMIKVIFAALALASITTPSSACTTKQQFFQESSLGSLALVGDARTKADMYEIYRRWCAIHRFEDARVWTSRSRLFFAINNRSEFEDKTKLFIAKIFRKSKATSFQPILTINLIGKLWTSSCSISSVKERNIHTLRSKNPIADFALNIFSPIPQLPRQPCGLHGYLNAKAFGNAAFSLSEYKNFLADIPEFVKNDGIENWSLSISAMPFVTRNLDERSERFPIFVINRQNDEQIFVQYLSVPDNFYSFSIYPDQLR